MTPVKWGLKLLRTASMRTTVTHGVSHGASVADMHQPTSLWLLSPQLSPFHLTAQHFPTTWEGLQILNHCLQTSLKFEGPYGTVLSSNASTFSLAITTVQALQGKLKSTPELIVCSSLSLFSLLLLSLHRSSPTSPCHLPSSLSPFFLSLSILVQTTLEPRGLLLSSLGNKNHLASLQTTASVTCDRQAGCFIRKTHLGNMWKSFPLSTQPGSCKHWPLLVAVRTRNTN